MTGTLVDKPIRLRSAPTAVEKSADGDAPLRYQVLGPLRVLGAPGPSINAYKVKVLLGILLTRAGHVVSLDQLIMNIWGDEPPQRATAAVHVYISQLRRYLRRRDSSRSPIITRSPGYLMDVSPADLDLHMFQDLVRRGRTHAMSGQHHEAADHFQLALTLWTGRPFEGLTDNPAIGAFATWMEEIRLECAESLVDCSLALGRHRQMIGLLRNLVAEHPLRETFHRQLMLALYRSERQADALKAYAAARRVIQGELGLEPCRTLQSLHRAILSADNDLYIFHAA